MIPYLNGNGMISLIIISHYPFTPIIAHTIQLVSQTMWHIRFAFLLFLSLIFPLLLALLEPLRKAFLLPPAHCSI